MAYVINVVVDVVVLPLQLAQQKSVDSSSSSSQSLPSCSSPGCASLIG